MHLILSHEQGDFDAVGSILGAWLLNPNALPVIQTRLNRNVRDYIKLFAQELPFIEFSKLTSDPIESVTLVDTQSMPTLKGMTHQTQVKVIDHHAIKAEIPDNWSICSEPSGACATLLIEQIKKAGIKITATQATLLLLAIYEDTGSMTYSHTTPQDVHAAAFMLEQGANLKIATKYLNPPLSDQQKALYDYLLTHAEKYEIKGQRIIISAGQAESMTDEISSIAHKMRDFLDPDALLLLVNTADGIRLVARSTTDRVNVATLASHFGGGGHERAAAALIKYKGDRQSEAYLNLDKYLQEIISILPECIHPSITVSQMMSRNPRLLKPDTSAEEAAQMMQRYGFEGYPVMDGDKVVGLLTRRAVDRSLGFKLNLSAGSLMEAGDFSVMPEDSLEHLQNIMIASNWGQIPVMDKESHKIIGIVTRTDLFKTLTGRKGKSGLPQKHNLANRLESILPTGKLLFLKMIAGQAHQSHMPLYIVGGFVRDLILNRPSIDFDLVIEGDAILLARKLVSTYGGRIISHKQFGTAKWQIDSIRSELAQRLDIKNPAELPGSIDLISARVEFYDRPTALPTVERSSIKFDLHRRDFSINTMALRLDGSYYGDLYDYWGGMNDLRQGVVRVLHSLSFVDDPTRMLRAIRFEQRFKFKIESRTLHLMKEAHDLVDHVSGDRLRHELDLILTEGDPISIFNRANSLGLLSAIHPALKWTLEDEPLLSALLNSTPPEIWKLGNTFYHMSTKRALFYLLWLRRISAKQGISVVKTAPVSKIYGRSPASIS